MDTHKEAKTTLLNTLKNAYFKSQSQIHFGGVLIFGSNMQI